MVVGKEVETGPDDELHLGPAALGHVDRFGQTLEPVAQEPLEDLVVEGLFRRKVVKQARTANSDRGGDVVVHLRADAAQIGAEVLNE